MNIIEKQNRSIKEAKRIVKDAIGDDGLTGKLWQTLNDEDRTETITSTNALDYSSEWTQQNIGEMQRVLVDYQLSQMRNDKAPMVFSVIKDVVKNISEKSIKLLDIGCTTGYYSEIFEHYFPNRFEYSGCDYNEESISMAKDNYPHINFLEADATTLPFEDEEYDIGFMSGVIEHIPEYDKALSELCRVSKDYLVLHRIKLTYGDTFVTKGTQYFVPIIRYTYNFSDFFDTLKTNGFEIIWMSNSFDGCYSYILSRKS